MIVICCPGRLKQCECRFMADVLTGHACLLLNNTVSDEYEYLAQ